MSQSDLHGAADRIWGRKMALRLDAKFILVMAVPTLLGLMQACGASFPGSKPPTPSRNASLDSLAGRSAEFSRVVRAISNLDPATRSEKAAGILVASQIAITNSQPDKTALDSGNVSGTCLLIYSGPGGLSDVKAFNSGDFALSDNGNVAYTAGNDFSPSDCQGVFTEALKDLPTASLDKWHVSFYKTSYE
jgi:hypothetical protein